MTHLPFAWAVALAAVSGFVALGYEILWMRFYSFASGSRAEAFGAMLGSYLLGLALGSLLSRHWQRDPGAETGRRWRALARLVAVSNMTCFLIIPLASRLVVHAPVISAQPLRSLVLVVIGAALLGTILPLLCHEAIPPDGRAGTRLSYLYLANIIGSGAGSLFTGFVLMDKLGLAQIAAGLLVFGLLVAMALAWFARAPRLTDGWLWAGAVALVFLAPRLHEGLFERLFYREEYRPGLRFDQVVESRHGVITVDTNRVIYGGGVYDGVIDTRLTAGSGLVRPYFISALHPHPREVLVIGVSGGAWTQILAHHPHVEKVTAVEISAGYLEVIRNYAQVASILTNSKVEFVIDDGRRWLRRHPDRRFDVIVMNTTFHWREFASALLSKEFLELVRDHLQPDGLAMWNCTGSRRAIRTGLEVFPQTLMVMNNCVGSRKPLIPNYDRWRSVLAQYRIDGRPVFDLSTPKGRRELEEVLAFGRGGSARGQGWRLLDRPRMEARYREAAPITDDNLGEEYTSSLGDLWRIFVP